MFFLQNLVKLKDLETEKQNLQQQRQDLIKRLMMIQVPKIVDQKNDTLTECWHNFFSYKSQNILNLFFRFSHLYCLLHKIYKTTQIRFMYL